MRTVSLKNRLFLALFLLCSLLLFSSRFVQARESSSSEAEETDLYNILLIGTDLREDESWNGNSDAVNYTLVENRIPYDDLYTSQNGNLVPDFPATIDRLHEDLYE